MRKLVFWILALGIYSVSAFAQEPRDFIRQFATPRIEFPDAQSVYAQHNPGRYPWFMHFLNEYVFEWEPSGRRAEYSKDCEPDLWAARIQDPRLHDVQLQGALIQKYFRDCDAQLKTGENSAFWNSMRIMSMKLDFKNHPLMHRVVFNLPGEVHLKALLALKGDRKKRPLIVLRLGVFGGVEEFLAERYLMMQLFEQSPFNVLVVENMSSADFIANNKRFSFGGYDEGLQNITIAKLLRDSAEPLSQLVQSVHFAGVSLGGHGVLYASLLNEWNDRPIQSFLGICPVVNLQASSDNLGKGFFFQRAVNLWSAFRMQGLRDKFSELQDASSFQFMPLVRETIQKNYTGGLSYSPGIILPAGFQDRPEFWKLNDFWWAYNNVTAPVLVLTTEKDALVPQALNAKNLKKKNIRVVSFDEGIHCTFAVPYRWDAFASLFQSYFLSHSAGFHLTTERLQMDVSDETLKAKDGALKFNLSWPAKQQKFIKVEIEDFRLSLPVNNFDFQYTKFPLGEPEKKTLERWLYQNLKINLRAQNDKKILSVSWPKVL